MTSLLDARPSRAEEYRESVAGASRAFEEIDAAARSSFHYQEGEMSETTDRERLEDVAQSARRMLRHGHDFWEKHEHSPESDEMSAALTDLYMVLKRHGLDREEDV